MPKVIKKLQVKNTSKIVTSKALGGVRSSKFKKNEKQNIE